MAAIPAWPIKTRDPPGQMRAPESGALCPTVALFFSAALALVAASTWGGTAEGNGNLNPAFVPARASFVYVDLNRAVNGSGLSPADPTNGLPPRLGDGRQLLFNSDNGVQAVPCGNDAIFVTGNDIRISSYGSGRATVSGFQIMEGGWSQVGTSRVWRRSFAGGASGAGPVVGSVIDLSSTHESPAGDVLAWQNLEAVGDKLGIFRSDPTVLPVGGYAYDWEQLVMYVNVGADPNHRQLGISCVGYFVNSLRGERPFRVSIHNLRLTGFARDAVNIMGDANHWHIHDNDIYAMGGMYNVRSKWYFGSAIQMSQDANNIEIDHNRIIQTFDSPITAQHFARSNGGYVHDLRIHDNFIDGWALGAVELSDFGASNRFSNITIEDNVAINGGQGFSRTGDTPQGYTDGIQVRGGGRSTFSNLVIRRNRISAHDSNIVIGGNNFADAIIIENNVLSDARYGIRNRRAHNASIRATGNTLCGNTVQIDDAAAGSHYVNNKLVAEGCASK